MRSERPAWVDDADPIAAPNDTQREALRRLLPVTVRHGISGAVVDIIPRRVHQSWVHHSTRDALLRRGWIVVDELHPIEHGDDL